MGVTGISGSNPSKAMNPVKSDGTFASEGTPSFQQLVEVHLDEIARAQVAYQQYKLQGRTDLAKGAHHWAQKQRQALQQLGAEASLYREGVDMSSRFHNKYSVEEATAYDSEQTGRAVRKDYQQWVNKVTQAYGALVQTPVIEEPPSAPQPLTQTAASENKAAPIPAKSENKVIHSAPERVRNFILKAAQEVDVDPHLLAAIAKNESGFREHVKSQAGAIGLFQLMPSTAKELGVNPYDSYQNVLGGAKYIKSKIDKYNGDVRLALAAYNAGPGNVDRAIKKAGAFDWDTVQSFLPKETRNFVPKVMRSYT